MSPRGEFWTTYRIGVAIALAFWLTSLCAVGWLIALLGGDVPFWPLLPLMAGAAVLGGMVAPAGGIPNAPPYCPGCGKSVFHAVGVGSIGLGSSPMWPEKDCSQCGYDLALGREP